jgi:hypothetical protein
MNSAPVDYTGRHLRFGWWGLLLFATLGLLLEFLHGFKIGAYVDVSNEARRLMWTLAHAHGTLLSAIHVLFGLSTRVLSLSAPSLRLISRCLTGASVFLPGGFFLGGVVFYGGDPGLGAVLIPLGAALLLTALFLIARATRSGDVADVGTSDTSSGAAKRPRR